MTDIELIHGDILVELTDIGEGISGDYDPNDPNDVSLVRFYVRRLVPITSGALAKKWEDIDDCSYCTRIPTGLSDFLLYMAAARIMASVKNAIERGTSLKDTCERLSWMDRELT